MPVGKPLTSAPEGVGWQLYQGVALPVSATDGPLRVDGPVHAGYTRTPTGALLAASQIGMRYVITPEVTGLRQVIDQQIVDDDGRTALLALYSRLTSNNQPAGGYAQYTAFRYLSWTPDMAVISLATKDANGVLQVGTDTLRWVDGDWRIALPPSGLQQPQVVQDLTGFVSWRGVS